MYTYIYIQIYIYIYAYTKNNTHTHIVVHSKIHILSTQGWRLYTCHAFSGTLDHDTHYDRNPASVYMHIYLSYYQSSYTFCI